MRQRKSHWIYMVYNWNIPVACYTNAASDVTVGTIFDCVEEDVTETIPRVSDKVWKEAVAAK